MARNRSPYRMPEIPGMEPYEFGYLPPPDCTKEEWDWWYYGIYLHSGWWVMQRMAVFLRRGAACEVCGSPEGLQVHHNGQRPYRAVLWNENVNEDLVVLCGYHHMEEHGITAA